jgi:hypothetical protein
MLSQITRPSTSAARRHKVVVAVYRLRPNGNAAQGRVAIAVRRAAGGGRRGHLPDVDRSALVAPVAKQLGSSSAAVSVAGARVCKREQSEGICVHGAPTGTEAMAARKKVAKKKTARRKAAKRELIDTGGNKLDVHRNKRGTSFKEVKDVGRSLAQDRRRKAKSVAKRGQGDRGDRRK